MDPIHLEGTLFLRCNEKYWNFKTVNDVVNNKNWYETCFLFPWDIAITVKAGNKLLWKFNLGELVIVFVEIDN